jgi:hypothetical protein
MAPPKFRPLRENASVLKFCIERQSDRICHLDQVSSAGDN